MRVSIVGCGYIGLVTGACLAEKGHRVVCVDVDEQRVAAVEAGVAPIFEPGLTDLLGANAGDRLRATTDLPRAVSESDIVLIAVGTPTDANGIDLSWIKEAARAIGAALSGVVGYRVVAVKSTVVPGTTDEIVLPILESASGKAAGRDFGVGVNPEFLTEGRAIKEFMAPDRIVLGGIDERALEVLDGLYGGFEDVPHLRTNNRTAEMIKYASNALLATCISFSNELANLCAAAPGVDVVDVLRGVHLSRYLTTGLPGSERSTAPLSAFLAAGCGFGGSCLPKDVKALIAWAEHMGISVPLLRAVIDVNQKRADEVVRLVKRYASPLLGSTVTVLGLAFKPDTDDVRESPAIPVIERLAEEGAIVRIYDPVASAAVPRLFARPNIESTGHLLHAVTGADVVVLVTQWDEFRDLPGLMAVLKRQPVLIDGRRMLDKRAFSRYDGIGL